MPTILSDETRIARKKHRCSLCFSVIEPGQRYQVEAYLGPYGDGIHTRNQCATCHNDDVTQMVWTWAGCPFEGIGTEDADEWAREMVAQGLHVERAVAYLARRGGKD